MGSDRFVILAIDSDAAGIWALLRGSHCGESSGFHFESGFLWGRYPLLCECGAETMIEVPRPVPAAALVEALQELFAWASVAERRLRPKLN
jgi:hypothetical protein